MSESHSQLQRLAPLVLTGILATGLFFVRKPLQSQRPERTPGIEMKVETDQQLEARLWEDPFAPAKRNGGQKAHSFSVFCEQIKRRATNCSKLNILFVPVPSGTYAEDSESRLRTRHAVLAGLGTQGYPPESAEKLGLVKVPWRAKLQDEDTICNVAHSLTNEAPGVEIPFEWFQGNRPRGTLSERPKSLVIWLPDIWEDHPARRLGGLKEAIIMQFGAGSEATTSKLSFSLIGPRTSGALARLAEDLELVHEKETTNGLFNIFSPWATAPASILLQNTESGGAGVEIAEFFQKRSIKFNTQICGDRELVKALLNELKLRGVDVVGEKGEVVLISEWDTLYGRTLPNVFVAEVLFRQNGDLNFDAHLSSLTGSHDWPEGLHQCGYLRGADGELAVSGAGQDDPDKLKAARDRLYRMERPEGKAQLDYLRRLSLRLKEIDRESKSRGRGGIKAIGILGSDVYDKFVVLQAVRPIFDRAIYFTTDLDARYYHPKELRFTRNMVVAAGHGLNTPEIRTNGVPPFRESYQTSIFEAVRHTLTGKAHTNQAKIYEIGNSRAIQLKPGTHDPAENATHPPKLILLGAIAGLFALLTVGKVRGWAMDAASTFGEQRDKLNLARRRLRTHHQTASTIIEQPFKLNWIRGTVLLIFLLLMVAPPLLLLYGIYMPAAGTAEPFFWTAGISIWPTEIIRVIVIWLCLLFLWRARHQLRLNKKEIAREFNLPKPISCDQWKSVLKPLLTRKISGIRRALFSSPVRAFFVWINRIRHRESLHVRSRKAEDIWNDYNVAGNLAMRIVRMLPPSVLYLAMGLSLVAIFPVAVPFRGLTSQVVDLCILSLAVAGQVMLTFFVYDAAVLCSHMIKRFTTGETIWPDRTLAEFQEKMGIHHLYLDTWIDMKLIGKRTQVITKLILYPFITLFLMIISRSAYFDNWNWPLSLIFILLFNAVLALAAVWNLRTAAERAREASLEALDDKILIVLSGRAPVRADQEQNLAEQLRGLRTKIENFREGAFSSLLDQPFLKAVLLPFGGVSLITIFELLISGW